MKLATKTSRGNGLVNHTTLTVASLLFIAGCATSTSELKQEIEVLLKQTVDEVRQETNRMDGEIALLRSEVGQLRSDVGQVNATVGGAGSEIQQLKSEVSLLQTDMHKNDTSLVDLAVRVSQIDRRLGKNQQQLLRKGDQAANPSGVSGDPVDSHVPATAAPSQKREPPYRKFLQRPSNRGCLSKKCVASMAIPTARNGFWTQSTGTTLTVT